MSIGAGTDRKAIDQLSEYMKLFQKENSIILDYTIKPWGKEGEVEYTFDIGKLTLKQQKAFCSHVAEMFKKNKLVAVGGSSPL
jgi:hypothetical protein